jgi:predicted permease
MRSVIRDLRYGIRMSFRNPGLATVALLSLGLGIGANTTLFSVLNTILLRPFPVKEPHRLAMLYETNLQGRGRRSLTFAAIQELKKQSRVFEDIALTSLGGGEKSATFSSAEGAAKTSDIAVSVNFFSVVGVAPALGRSFVQEDSVAESGSAIILSHEFWQRHFGGDGNIIGQVVSVEGRKKTIVGVMPPGFWLFPWDKDTDVWAVFNPAKFPNTRWQQKIGRLKAGVTIEQAQAEMDTLFRGIAEQQPKVYKGWGIRVEPLHEWAVGGYRNTLYLLLGAVGFVLLIACANVANLLLARASARQKEIAVRASLGAGRFRLVRQLLTESMGLALLGGLLGILVALWGIDLFAALAPQWFARASEISIDTTVLGFTLGLSLLTGLLFGLAPALQSSRPDLNEALKEAGGRSAAGSRGRGRSALVVSEIALALVLLMGAGLMINSFIRLQAVDLGFDGENVLKAEILLAGSKYWTQLKGDVRGDIKRVTPEADLFFQELLQRVRRLPGVVSASMGSLNRMLPMRFRIAGESPESGDQQRAVPYAEVSPEFFRTMGIPLLKGRALSDRDVEGSPWVVVISESFAKRFFPNEDPIGKLLYLTVRGRGFTPDLDENHPREIVGLVRDVRYWGPRGNPPFVIYGSYLQHPWDYPGGTYSYHHWKKLVIRTATDPMSLAPALQRVVAELDKDQVVFDVMTMDQMVSEFVAPQRFWMRLFGIFAGLAVFLAVVGIYGVMSYSVSRRTHEIGVRMAMGAQRRDVLKLILGHGLKLALIGVVIGVAGSFALTRLIEGFLYDVKPTDPVTFIAVSLVLTAVALAASYIPARRATQIDPMAALRHE